MFQLLTVCCMTLCFCVFMMQSTLKGLVAPFGLIDS